MPTHLRGDFRGHPAQGNAVPWHPAQRNTASAVAAAPRRRGLTTLEALEVIRRRYEAAQRDTHLPAEHQQYAA